MRKSIKSPDTQEPKVSLGIFRSSTCATHHPSVQTRRQKQTIVCTHHRNNRRGWRVPSTNSGGGNKIFRVDAMVQLSVCECYADCIEQSRIFWLPNVNGDEVKIHFISIHDSPMYTYVEMLYMNRIVIGGEGALEETELNKPNKNQHLASNGWVNRMNRMLVIIQPFANTLSAMCDTRVHTHEAEIQLDCIDVDIGLPQRRSDENVIYRFLIRILMRRQPTVLSFLLLLSSFFASR